MTDYLERAEESRERNEGLAYEAYHDERSAIMTTPDYWTMPDADLASAYRALRAVTEFTDASEEQLLFAEDAIMQRIGAPDDADPSVSPEWEAAAVKWASDE